MPVSLDPLDHLGLVIDTALPYRDPGQSVLDSEAFGDGALMLVQVLRRADPTRPGDVSAYLARSIQGGIWNGLKRRSIGRKRATRRLIVPFTDLEDESTPRGGWGYRLADHREPDRHVEDRDLACWLLRHLTDRERRLVERVVMQGWPVTDAAAAEDPPISHQRVSQIVDRAKRKLARVAAGPPAGSPET